jgi:hypothetical protein
MTAHHAKEIFIYIIKIVYKVVLKDSFLNPMNVWLVNRVVPPVNLHHHVCLANQDIFFKEYNVLVSVILAFLITIIAKSVQPALQIALLAMDQNLQIVFLASILIF